MNKELWRKVRGYSGLYEVSNLGRVRSLDRVIPQRNNSTKVKSGRVLKPTNTKQGYSVVRLCSNCVEKDFPVHRLVAAAFLPSSTKEEVNHKNGIKDDNRVSNLEWVTPKENMTHARDSLRNGAHTAAKITVENVRDILKMHKKGYSASEIAVHFDLHPISIRRIRRGVTWKHIVGAYK